MEVDRIYNEDCLVGLNRLPDGVIDMVLTDLPFGTTSNHWDKRLPLDQLWIQYKRVCKPTAAIVMFSQLPFAVDLINANRKWFRYEWIWEKTFAVGFYNCNKMPLRAHENILVFYKHLPKYNPQWGVGKPYVREHELSPAGCYSPTVRVPTENDGRRYPRDVLKGHVMRGFGRYAMVHPTQKPVEILEYLIRTYTDEGELVLDNCMGSGSTAVACVNTGRHYIGYETEAGYVEIAKQRIEEARQCGIERQSTPDEWLPAKNLPDEPNIFAAADIWRI